jgi:hypothetical protein
MVNCLYVSFWDLCLDNLPQGRFERRVLGAGDASQMIRAAQVDKTLLCVSDCCRKHHAVGGGGAKAGRSTVDRDMQLPTLRKD